MPALRCHSSFKCSKIIEERRRRAHGRPEWLRRSDVLFEISRLISWITFALLTMLTLRISRQRGVLQPLVENRCLGDMMRCSKWMNSSGGQRSRSEEEEEEERWLASNSSRALISSSRCMVLNRWFVESKRWQVSWMQQAYQPRKVLVVWMNRMNKSCLLSFGSCFKVHVNRKRLLTSLEFVIPVEWRGVD